MMIWNFKRKLTSIGKRGAPEPAFVKQLEASLQTAGYLPRSRFAFAPSWKTVMASMTLVVSLASGTTAYAYASDNVLPDHPLYVVRTQVEQLQVSLVQGAEKKEIVRLKHLQRRSKEARLLLARNGSVPEAHAQAVLHELQVAASEPSATTSTSFDDEDFDRQYLSMNHQELAELLREKRESTTEQDRKELNDLVLQDIGQIEKPLQSLERRKRQENRVEKHDRRSRIEDEEEEVQDQELEPS